MDQQPPPLTFFLMFLLLFTQPACASKQLFFLQTDVFLRLLRHAAQLPSFISGARPVAKTNAHYSALDRILQSALGTDARGSHRLR